MTKIILSGCNGKMGRVITERVKNRSDCEIVLGIDKNTKPTDTFQIVASPNEIDCKADVIIDFSHPSLLTPLLNFAVNTKTAIVLCTTGYEPEQVEELKAASKKIPVFYSRNMSLGINLLIELSKKAADILGKDFDIEIIEEHHNQKIDAPSGTALMIADAVSKVREESMHYVYDRHSQRKKRSENEIGIHSIRGGTIVGEHRVIFAGNQETLTLSHSAQSKEVFANGAVNAAIYLAGKPAGLYDMSALV